MVTCPRCEFTQPKDRYCANCGLDIENYKPQKPPALSRIWNNPWTQICIMILLLTATVNYLLYKNKLTPEIEITDQKITKLTTKSPKSFQKKGLKSLKKASTKTALVEVKSPRPESQKKVQTLKAPTKITIKFAEVSAGFLNSIQTPTTRKGSQIQALSVNDQGTISNFIGKYSMIDVLPGGATKGLSLNSPAFISFTANIEELEHGFFIEALPSQIAASGSTFTLKINASLPANEPLNLPDMQVSLEDEITLLPNEILIITDILSSQRNLAAEERSLLGPSPLNVLTSKEFLNNDTEFIIFIQTK